MHDALIFHSEFRHIINTFVKIVLHSQSLKQPCEIFIEKHVEKKNQYTNSQKNSKKISTVYSIYQYTKKYLTVVKKLGQADAWNIKGTIFHQLQTL